MPGLYMTPGKYPRLAIRSPWVAWGCHFCFLSCAIAAGDTQEVRLTSTHTHTQQAGALLSERGVILFRTLKAWALPYRFDGARLSMCVPPPPTPQSKGLRATGLWRARLLFQSRVCKLHLHEQPPRNCGCKLWPQLSAHLQKPEHCCRSDEGDWPSTSVAR